MAYFQGTRSKYSTYQICVMILEARHLRQVGNPVVIVKFGNQKRRTVVREGTDCPIYNEYFVFDFAGELERLLGTRITIAVYLRNCLRQLKFYGSAVFEVEAVWEQPDHQYYHKWAILGDPKCLSREPKGYVKCNVAVRAKGEKVRVYPEMEGEDDIEGNLLLPLGGEASLFGQRARYIFTVYRADGLPNVSSLCGFGDVGGINPYVRISFAGMKGSTRIAWRTCTPRFNERIIFKETFPSFCRRIKIAIKYRVDGCRSRNLTTRVIHTRQISNSGEYGFLPTYGPSFLHFYGSDREGRNSCSFGRRASSFPFYRGRVLLSLKTEMDEPEGSPRIGVETEPAVPIIEKSLWKVEEYILVGIIYDICMIDRRRFASKSIIFELSIGNVGNQRFSRDRCNVLEDNDEDPIAGQTAMEKRVDFENQTVPRTTGTLDGKYNYLPLGSRKPCIYVRSWWPNSEGRMFNANNLRFIANFLEEKLEEVETLATVENPRACGTYNEAIRTFKSHCLHYLHTLDDGRYDAEGGTTKLDRHRVNVCRKQIEDILRRIKIDGELPNNHYIGIAMMHAYQYLRELRELCEDPQDSLPRVFLWMLAGSRRVACAELPAERLIYSEESRERGEECGRRINVFPKCPSQEYELDETIDYRACKIELFLWLGNSKFVASCWSSIPPGYLATDHEGSLDVFPKYFEYDRSSTFRLRAHIFQGRFEPGMDTSALLDPFVRVTFRGYTLTTRVVRQSLDPLWDESLLFPPVTIHGTKEYVKVMPPRVVLQAFDQDICGMKEFCGMCIAVPLVKLIEEVHSSADFPTKLEWYHFQSRKDCTGSILAAFELIETEETDSVDMPLSQSTLDEIRSIPSDIRPKMASYRLEVIFWGVRDMRKLHCVPVYRPRIVVECAGIYVKSRVMENAKKFCNFEEPRVMVDLEMPELDVYYPSVTIRAYDSRGFGCFKYAGICIVPTVYVFLEQLITEEDYRALIYETKRTTSVAKWRKRKEEREKGSRRHDIPDNLNRSEDRNSNGARPLIACQAAVWLPSRNHDFTMLTFERNEQRARPDFKKGKKNPFYSDSWSEERKGLIGHKERFHKGVRGKLRDLLEYIKRLLGLKRLIAKKSRQSHDRMANDEGLDWWSKYFASLEEEKSMESSSLSSTFNVSKNISITTFKIYSEELENQAEFNGFQDRLSTFELWKGKRKENLEDDTDGLAGKFKVNDRRVNGSVLLGHISVYRWPHPENLPCRTRRGRDAANGLCDDYPPQDSVKVLVRLYVIKGINLQPKDPLNGKSDPYLCIGLGKRFINDSKNYIPNQLNPTFGRVFEMEATFPQDYMLTVQVWDRDATTTDDLIGETRIDIENRFYSRHRATCGLAKTYETSGYNAWRDREKPKQILDFLCKRNNLPAPVYGNEGVQIGKRKFPFHSIIDYNDRDREECMALRVLHQWKEFPICGCALVPEHVERRPLFNAARPGLEQGRLELWVDMFPTGNLPPKPVVNVAPLEPEEYEIRAIVWNTEDVPLVESQFLTGEKSSDIYVKGWILQEDRQRTDIHYNSLSGEGNFNWRFVFRVVYSKSENVMVVRKKLSVFARNETEEKLPCRLNLEVWDSDHFSADDFLGALTLDLSKMPRGSANSETCTMKLIEPNLPTINLFKATHLKAWWPLVVQTKDGAYVQAGKIELELSALRAIEANERPAGRGRDPPQGLPSPRRPDTSFSWFRNPWRACYYVLCRYYKWRMVLCVSCVLLVLLVACGIYALPGYLVKRLLGA